MKKLIWFWASNGDVAKSSAASAERLLVIGTLRLALGTRR
jgi:hypothetical protein